MRNDVAKTLWSGIVPGVVIVSWLGYISIETLSKPSVQSMEKAIKTTIAARQDPYLFDQKLISQQLSDMRENIKNLTSEVKQLRADLYARTFRDKDL